MRGSATYECVHGYTSVLLCSPLNSCLARHGVVNYANLKVQAEVAVGRMAVPGHSLKEQVSCTHEGQRKGTVCVWDSATGTDGVFAYSEMPATNVLILTQEYVVSGQK